MCFHAKRPGHLLLMILLLPLLGCGQRVADKSSTIEVEVDAGVAEKDLSVSCQVPGGSGTKVVKNVSVSCGCTSTAFAEGDELDLAQPFKVAISTGGRAPGTDTQRVLITFKDDTSVGVKIKYEFRPMPYIKPSYLVLEPGADKSVSVVFPGEKDVGVVDLALPDGVTCTQKDTREEGVATIAEVTFTLSSDSSFSEPEGKIQITTNSQRRSTLSIPYLLLENRASL